MMTEKKKTNRKIFILILVIIGALIIVESVIQGMPGAVKLQDNSDMNRSELPTSKHTELITIKEGPSWENPTVWIHNVYYDGSVEKIIYDENYIIDRDSAEIVEEETYQLEEEDLQELYYILNHDFLKYDEGELPLESNGWNIKYYDPEGNLVHEFLIGGANLECIERIVYIVCGY